MRLHLYTHKVVQISFCKWPLPERRCYFFVCHLCERLSSRRPLIQMPFVRSIILTRDSGNKMAQLLALNWHVSFHEFYPSSIVSSGQQWPPYQYIFAEIGKRKKIKNRNSEKKNFFLVTSCEPCSVPINSQQCPYPNTNTGCHSVGTVYKQNVACPLGSSAILAYNKIFSA